VEAVSRPAGGNWTLLDLLHGAGGDQRHTWDGADEEGAPVREH